MPSGYFVKETLDHFHNSLSKVLSGHFVKETLEFFHNSLYKVSSGNFVTETPGFFHNSLHNIPIKNLSHSSRVLLKRAHQCDHNVLNHTLTDFFWS